MTLHGAQAGNGHAAGAGTAAPELHFSVQGVTALRPAAAPTLRFALRIDAGEAAIRSVMLDVQLRIAAPRRGYDARERRLLADLFGTPDRWRDTLRALPWTRATVVVAPFTGTTVADLDVPCTYDFEVAAARYLASLSPDGVMPLELQFSGSVFHVAGDGRMQVTRIPWDREATCAPPVRVWREAVEQRYPGSAWLRVDREAFERLAAFRADHALTSWEAVLEELLTAYELDRSARP
jgi:uncharacterized protein DUF6084